MATVSPNIVAAPQSGACRARTSSFVPRSVAGWTRFTREGDVPGFVGGLPHRAVFDYSYDGTMRSVEQSLLRLGTDRLDLFLIHDVDVWTHGIDAIEDRFREAMAGAYVALDRLRAEGRVAGIGMA